MHYEVGAKDLWGGKINQIKNLLKDFKKNDVITGIIVGLIGAALFKFSTGLVVITVSILLFTIITQILAKKTKSKPDISTMVGTYWIILAIGASIIYLPKTTLSPAAVFLSSLLLTSIYSFIIFLLTVFILFVVSLILGLKSSKKKK